MEIEKIFPKKLIFGKYQIQKQIGFGTFSSVFSGINIIDNSQVAIKIENNYKGYKLLETEAYFLHTLKGFGIPEIKSFGRFGNYNILIESLLGKSLLDIMRQQKIKIKDVCMIAIQLIDRLEFIHSKYIIHRDIKPENCVLDLESQKFIFLIDFGLSRKYRSSRTGNHIKFAIPRKIYGSLRYCSINASRGTEQSRRDDMESLAYLLIYLFKRILPWQRLDISNDVQNRCYYIYEYKKKILADFLCKKMPKEFAEYLQYTKSLQFEEEPNYNYARSLFLKTLNNMNDNNDLKFSWLLQKNNVFINWIKRNNSQNFLDSKKKYINKFKKKLSPRLRILKNLESSLEKNRNVHSFDKIRNISELKIENKDSRIFNNLKEIKIKTNDNCSNSNNTESNENITLNNKIVKSFTDMTFFNKSIDYENENIPNNEINESPQFKKCDSKINLSPVSNENKNNNNDPKNQILNNSDKNLQNTKNINILSFHGNNDEKCSYNLLNQLEKKSFDMKNESDKKNMNNNTFSKSYDSNFKNCVKENDNSINNNIMQNRINYNNNLQVAHRDDFRIIDNKQNFNINYKNYQKYIYKASSIHKNYFGEKDKNNTSNKKNDKEHLKVIKLSKVLNKEKNINERLSQNNINNANFIKRNNLLYKRNKELNNIKNGFAQKNKNNNEIKKNAKTIKLKSINFFNIENNQFNSDKANFFEKFINTSPNLNRSNDNSPDILNIVNTLNSKKHFINTSKDYNKQTPINRNINNSKIYKCNNINNLRRNSSFGIYKNKSNNETAVNKVYRSYIKRNLSK